MDLSRLTDHIVCTLLKNDGSEDILNPITPDMFEHTDIKEVIQDANMFFVAFRGINGIIPMRFFNPDSQVKITNWLKIQDSPLWRSLNDKDS
jgi:hypothetical protein